MMHDVQLTAAIAAQGATRDLLEAERALRALAEEENRDLRAALQLAAYTFAGAAYEEEVHKDQRILDRWTPQDWMDFFQRVAPISQGWSDPATLAERLGEVTQERDQAMAEISRLRSDVQTLRSELASRVVSKDSPALAPPPQAPLLCRWHVIPEPTENDLSVIVYGWEDVMPATDAFINALGRWTVWPTLPVWAESLYRLGWRSQLLHRLKCEGVDYAFALAAEGWDEVIDRGVKEGTLLIPDDVPLHA
jgi:hypothetical protein